MQQIEKLKKDALGFPEKAKRLIVHNSKTLEATNGFILAVKEMKKEIAESYDPIISHAKAEKKKYTDPLNIAEQIARLNVTSYLEDQAEIQRKVKEKARKIEEARQKKEDDALERAKKLRDKGKEKKADAIIEKIPLPPVIEEPLFPDKPAGVSLKRIVDTEKINRTVELGKGKCQIPGIRIYPVWKWEITDRSKIPSSYYKSTSMHRG